MAAVVDLTNSKMDIFEKGDCNKKQKTNQQRLPASWLSETKQNLLQELSRIGYCLGGRIGEGSYSKVYSANYSNKKGQDSTGRQMACKVIDRRNTSSDFCDKFLPREIEIIKQVKHQHIVQIHSILEMGPYMCVFMEYCSYGDLLERVKNYGALSERRAKLYFGQLVSALSYMHSIDVSHRDIKCENILIHNRHCIKLTDFGFARKVEQQPMDQLSSTFCGSAAYAAPEVLNGIPYDPKLYDMWSLGCVLFIMVTGSMPYDDENISATMQKQAKHIIDYPNNVIVAFPIKSIINGLLEPDVGRRTRVDQLVSHPWVK